MTLRDGGIFVLCVSGAGYTCILAALWALKSESESIQLLQAKIVTTFYKIRLCEKRGFFLILQGKIAFYIKKKKENHIARKKYNFLVILWRYGCCTCHC